MPANTTGASAPTPTPAPVWLDAAQCDLADLQRLVETPTRAEDYPRAAQIIRNVPAYDSVALRGRLRDPDARLALTSEWVRALSDGPGAVLLRGAFNDLRTLDAVTGHFRELIEIERAGGATGDHFAKPGVNYRVWNALEKLCLRDPERFAAYYGNDLLALISEAWLGPGYQMTAQVNCVNPGGTPQNPHRDYHLGFMSTAQAAHFPAHVHRLSPALTLQVVVAHVDMPLESGPTMFLPHSQKYLHGYLATGLPAFEAYFAANHVQLPLQRGDAIFLSPAVIHAAGHNRTTDVYRIGNLLQISSAFGRAMETVDRVRMSRVLYPVLRAGLEEGRISRDDAWRAIASCAEGYAFPTNLDLDPSLGGLAPENQQALMWRALQEGWETARFEEALRAHDRRRALRPID
jgi:ectoine hydroxylase-related dioxygenase (phytanoyl-CoA dioxygenase family)